MVDVEKYHRQIFLISWLSNLALWLLVVWVLFKTIVAPVEQPFGVGFSYAAFTLLFVLFSIALAIHLKTKSYVSMIFLIIFMIGQLICVLVTSITIFSDERVYEKLNFSENPSRWITSHRWLPILFLAVFIPIFVVQVYVVNHHTQSKRTLTTESAESATDFQRKNTPYHGDSKGDYMPADTQE